MNGIMGFVQVVNIGMCGPKGYGFSAVLVINSVLFLAILVINWIWHSLFSNWVCLF